MMEKLGFMFIGLSGSGKGTQSTLLKKFLEERHGESSVIFAYAGENFRKLMENDGYTASLSKKVTEGGKLNPGFLAVWAWSTVLVNSMEDNKHLIMDGSPRKLMEAELIDEAMEFYGIEKVYPIFLDIGFDVAKDRLMARGRADDNEEGIKERFAYYERDVVPVIEYFKNESKNKLIEVNGEQSVEGIHKEIIEKIFNVTD
ncbi:MAG: nucleoside monophosphate kinase [Parcubacteria group bacterium]|nr:nucleoside monophosphate kinase [Parcubacteria group bacterium]MCR4342682.1 nucleoside monophosphate kinase [Patescibacteria group bacterium]